MKKFLLTVAAAAMTYGSVHAQAPLLKLESPISATMLKSNKSIFGPQKGEVMPVMFKAPQTRIADSERSHKMLSYLLGKPENQQTAMGSFGFTYKEFEQQTGGATGYGIAQLYTPDLLSRYAGNKISQIDFCLCDAEYSDVILYVIDLGAGQFLMTQEVPEVKTCKTVNDELKIEVNSVACDFEIPANCGPLLIGWAAMNVSQSPTDPNGAKAGPSMIMNADPTFSGQGAYLIGTKAPNNIQPMMPVSEFGMPDGSTAVFTSAIYIHTTGEGGVKDNDAVLGSVPAVRGNMNSNAKAVLSVANLGLDPLKSFDYKIEVDGEVKNATYTFQNPLPYCNGAQVEIEAPLAKQQSSKQAVMTIEKANGVADEYVANNDNVKNFNVMSFEKGYHRVPVVEEFTSTYCVMCPLGHAAMDKLDEYTQGNHVKIVAHNDFQGGKDPLKSDSYLKVGEMLQVQGYPSAYINRQYVAPNIYRDLTDAVKVAAATPVEASLTVTATTPNTLNKKTTATTEIEFLFDTNANDYSVIYVVTEDEITGIKQYNALATLYNNAINSGLSKEQALKSIYSQLGVEGDQPYLWETIENSKYDAGARSYYYEPVFNNTAVTINDPSGNLAASKLPAAKAGQKITHKATITIPSRRTPTVKNANLKIAALLIENSTGMILTGRQCKLGETSTPSAIEGVTSEDFAEITVQAGAFNVKAENAKAEVYAADGKLVSSCIVNGEASLPTFGQGVYVIRVEANGNVITKKAAF